jgi:hypothetical protein
LEEIDRSTDDVREGDFWPVCFAVVKILDCPLQHGKAYRVVYVYMSEVEMPRRASKSSWQHTCRTATAILLTVGFLGLLIAVTAFGMVTNNREMLAGVLKIVTYGIMFSCGWAGGTSWLRGRQKKFQRGVKDFGFHPVSSNVESQKEGEQNVPQSGLRSP